MFDMLTTITVLKPVVIQACWPQGQPFPDWIWQKPIETIPILAGGAERFAAKQQTQSFTKMYAGQSPEVAP